MIPLQRRRANSSAGATSMCGKSAMSWYSSSEELQLGAQLLRLVEAVRPICASEPRLLKLAAPVYVIGIIVIIDNVWPERQGPGIETQLKQNLTELQDQSEMINK